MGTPNDPIDALTVRFEEGGQIQVDELGKAVLAHSPTWATIAFLARERDPATGAFSSPRVSLRRYKRRGGRFVVDKHFTLTNGAQALALMTAIERWFPIGAAEALAGDEAEADSGEEE
jgi:hypothetical protein